MTNQLRLYRRHSNNWPLPERIVHDLRGIWDFLMMMALPDGFEPNSEGDFAAREFAELMDLLSEAERDCVDAAYSLAVDRPFQEFWRAIGFERMICYVSMIPLRKNIDASLVDTAVRWRWPFWNLSGYLHAPPRRLAHVLWQGKWRERKYLGAEYQGLQNELYNWRRRESRAEQKLRELDRLSVPVDSAHHVMVGVDPDEFDNLMQRALYKAWEASLPDEDKLRLSEDVDWKVSGKQAGLSAKERKVLAARSTGSIRRTKDNAAAYRAINRARSELAIAIRPHLISPGPRLIKERVAGKFIFAFTSTT